MRRDDPTWPTPSSPAATASMLGNTWRDTKPEVAVRSILHRRGRRFRKRFTIQLGIRRWTQPDIVFPGAKLAVFIDGCFWHCCPLHGTEPTTNSQYWRNKLERNVVRDRDTDERLASMGWNVIRGWEHDHPAALADRIETVLGEP